MKLRCWLQRSVPRTQNSGDLEHVIALGRGGLRLRPQPCEYSCAVWCNTSSETTLQFDVPSDSSRGLWTLFMSAYFEAGWTECIITILLLLLSLPYCHFTSFQSSSLSARLFCSSFFPSNYLLVSLCLENT